MAVQLDCSPCYDGEPDYDPNEGTAILTKIGVSRSRSAGIGGATQSFTADTTQFTVDTTQFTADQTFIKVTSLFARSKLSFGGNIDFQGRICNFIALQIIAVDTSVPLDGIIDQYELVIYFLGVEVERYVTTLQPEDCGQPAGGGGIINDNGAVEDLRTQVNAFSNFISMPVRGIDINDSGKDPICLEDEGPTLLEGAVGPTAANVPAIRTGPDRSILFTNSKEIDNTGLIGWPTNDNMIQWDFDTEFWVPYGPNEDCRLAGTDC